MSITKPFFSYFYLLLLLLLFWLVVDNMFSWFSKFHVSNTGIQTNSADLYLFPTWVCWQAAASTTTNRSCCHCWNRDGGGNDSNLHRNNNKNNSTLILIIRTNLTHQQNRSVPTFDLCTRHCGTADRCLKNTPGQPYDSPMSHLLHHGLYHCHHLK